MDGVRAEATADLTATAGLPVASAWGSEGVDRIVMFDLSLSSGERVRSDARNSNWLRAKCVNVYSGGERCMRRAKPPRQNKRLPAATVVNLCCWAICSPRRLGFIQFFGSKTFFFSLHSVGSQDGTEPTPSRLCVTGETLPDAATFGRPPAVDSCRTLLTFSLRALCVEPARS